MAGTGLFDEVTYIHIENIITDRYKRERSINNIYFLERQDVHIFIEKNSNTKQCEITFVIMEYGSRMDSMWW